MRSLNSVVKLVSRHHSSHLIYCQHVLPHQRLSASFPSPLSLQRSGRLQFYPPDVLQECHTIEMRPFTPWLILRQGQRPVSALFSFVSKASIQSPQYTHMQSFSNSNSMFLIHYFSVMCGRHIPKPSLIKILTSMSLLSFGTQRWKSKTMQRPIQISAYITRYLHSWRSTTKSQSHGGQLIQQSWWVAVQLL